MTGDSDLFPITRAEGLRRLELATPRLGRTYAERRNHDLGPADRSTVSALSPFVRRRLLHRRLQLAMSKRLLNNSLNVTLEEALDDEGLSQSVNFGTADTAEAMRAFVEKRSPVFRGR